MRDALLAYFAGERGAGLLAAVIGVAGLAAAAVFAPARWELRPLAITLGVFALVELAVGVGLYLRTGPQVDALLSQLASDAPGFYAAEGARMAKVQRNFVALRYVWLGLIVATAAAAAFARDRPTLTLVALGVLVNASFMLAFDVVAERRGAVYYEQLRREGAAAEAGAARAPR